jgi:hypothetical protein
MLEKIVKFFQSRTMSMEIQPTIRVSYSSWEAEINLALKEEWEDLLKELDENPKIIKNRKWTSYSGDMRQEEMILQIDGIVIELTGPRYPDPKYVKPIPDPPKTQIESANESIDNFFGQGPIIWALTHCSEVKYEALIQFIKATRVTRAGA